MRSVQVCFPELTQKTISYCHRFHAGVDTTGGTSSANGEIAGLTSLEMAVGEMYNNVVTDTTNGTR